VTPPLWSTPGAKAIEATERLVAVTEMRFAWRTSNRGHQTCGLPARRFIKSPRPETVEITLGSPFEGDPEATDVLRTDYDSFLLLIQASRGYRVSVSDKGPDAISFLQAFDAARAVLTPDADEAPRAAVGTSGSDEAPRAAVGTLAAAREDSAQGSRHTGTRTRLGRPDHRGVDLGS
jgi:hypothetical protein